MVNALSCMANADFKVIVLIFLGIVFVVYEKSGSSLCSDIPLEQDIFARIHG